MKIEMVNAQREEEKKGKSFGSMFKKALGFGSRPENTYANYLKRHNIDVGEVMECPICMCDFEPLHKVTGLQCSNVHLYHDQCLQKQLDAGDKKCAMCRARV